LFVNQQPVPRLSRNLPQDGFAPLADVHRPYQ
jgi:hypothetical protein